MNPLRIYRDTRRDTITAKERDQIDELLAAARAPQKELSRIYEAVKHILDDREDYTGWICDAVFGQPIQTADDLLENIEVKILDDP